MKLTVAHKGHAKYNEQVAGYMLHVHVACCMLQDTNYKLQVASYKLQVACYKSQVAVNMLQVTCCKLQVASCKLQVAGCMLPVESGAKPSFNFRIFQQKSL